jgi:predicted kinase
MTAPARIVRVLVGPPGSGKTTFRSRWFPEHHLISPDEFLTVQRGFVKIYEWSPRACSEAWKKSYQMFGLALRQSKDNILWDATFGTEISRSAILHTAKGFGYEVEAYVMSTPLEICLKRNAARTPDRRVPEANIRSYFATFQMPTMNEGFNSVVSGFGEGNKP